MGIYITNVAAMRGMNYLNRSTNSLNTIFQRLSSGLRINSAKDDPAGLQISNRLTSEINGLAQASRNASDGIAFAQVVEGTMDEMVNLLQRMRTLSVQAATGTVTSDDREAIQGEIDQLSAEITRLAEQTTYAGKTVLLGKDSGMYNADGKLILQVGAYSGHTIEIDMSQSFKLDNLVDKASGGDGTNTPNNVDGYDSTKHAFNVLTADGASDAIGLIDKVINVVDSQRTGLGAIQNRLESTIRVNDNTRVNLSDARSRIRDTDYAEEAANLFQEQIRQQAATMMLMQSMQSSNIILKLLQGI